ncbi:elongation factor P maturation arginine rhamnosyltransferase EarP [Castellaniella sp. MT123]|uniref:elongation factor P maturation arginine rhamnosyltransferase EarP n=1 Tax=Castellaniella sp. MT123 TaxID=3140381 RepID=UPI0031F3985B
MDLPAFDLFCRVIDNFGDAGVCWRLAHRLAGMGHTVRLWIDDLETLGRLVPAVRPAMEQQQVEGVRIGSWAHAGHAPPPEDGVVIEAFACALPARYENAMAARRCLWINLEYLSAESWVEGCHGLPSPQPNGVPKYFFFPGFTQETGGLLREPDLTARRDQARKQDRRQRLQALTGLHADTLPANARHILLFCYPDAPLAGLRAGLVHQEIPTCLLVPGGRPAGLTDEGSLRVLPIPFVPQTRFDELLWCCDLNFVRGEDSLVRALWAGSPLVWQIYRQAESAHLDKLDAWLTLARWPDPAQALTQAWNRQDDTGVCASLLQVLQPDPWHAWQARCRDWSGELAARADLAQNLVDFCQKCRQKS